MISIISLLGLSQEKHHHRHHLLVQPAGILGSTITPAEGSQPFDINLHYKYGSFLGFGGDMNAEYVVQNYKTAVGEIPVFILKNAGFPTNKPQVVDVTWSYGKWSGLWFLVHQDQERQGHKINQWRFIKALGKSSGLYKLGESLMDKVNELVNSKTGESNFESGALIVDPVVNFKK